MSISINFNSTEQKNREFIGSYWKQKNHLGFMFNFSQKSFSPSAKIIYFSSLHHCEYSHFSIKPQNPTQVGFFENASLPQGGWASGPEGLWDNQDICLYGGRTLLSWEATQATCGGHPTLVILVHLLFYSDSFHFRPGISREVLQHWD